MSKGAFSKLPREIRDQIWSAVLQGGKHLIVEPQAYLRRPSKLFRFRVSSYPPPAYAGILVASKSISAEVQETLYRKCTFRAYLCKHIDRVMDAPRPDVFSRLQKVEIFLDISIRLPFFHIHPPGHPARYYSEWFRVFSDPRVRRELCRVTIANVNFGTDVRATDNHFYAEAMQQFLPACKRFAGFKTVVLEMSEVTPLRYYAATDPIQEAEYAGDRMEALKHHLETELAPTLGYCHYYDRSDFCCLEFRPRDDVNPIRAAQAPYVDPPDEDSE